MFMKHIWHKALLHCTLVKTHVLHFSLANFEFGTKYEAFLASKLRLLPGVPETPPGADLRRGGRVLLQTLRSQRGETQRPEGT